MEAIIQIRDVTKTFIGRDNQVEAQIGRASCRERV